MFQLGGFFDTFLAALQERMGLTYGLRALTEKACLLYPEDRGIYIVFYRCGAGRRIAVPVDGRCIHIDEDLCATRLELLLSRIAALSGQAQRIHARETVVARIEKRIAHAFLLEHHLQVALPGKYRYGLYHGGELVAVAVFSGGRRMDSKPTDYRSYELLRFCHKQGAHVVGGFSKLLHAFGREFKQGDIMTYVDKDWSDGTRYRKLGFTVVGETEPQRFWVDIRTMQRYYERTLPPEIAKVPPDGRSAVDYVAVYNSGSFKVVYF